MYIHCGLHLDGQRGWPIENRLGEAVTGPLGLLDLLETHLGLGQASVSPAARIAQYRDCLRQCDRPERFYHRSFHLDELGTAADLLGWRETWYLHGWHGGAFAAGAAASRLNDLAEVERLAAGGLPPGPGERLQRVAQALQRRRTPIAGITLHDPPTHFPKAWQAVLARLPVTRAAALPAGQGFLGAVQERLLRARQGETVEPLAWREDGTVTVVQAETLTLAGRWLAARLDGRDTLLVAPAGGEPLDALLAAAGHPRPGLHEPSPLRPALQVLPLALELLWEPLDLEALLQFLTLPVGPLRGFARRALTDALVERPGLGSAPWRQALTRIDAHYAQHSAGRAQAVREEIAFWIEPPRHAPETGAALAAVRQRADRLRQFFQQRMSAADSAHRTLLAAACQQCQAFGEALATLQSQGLASLRPRQMQQLAAQATAAGCGHPWRGAEAGACRTVTRPGAAIAPTERVVWWQLARPVLPAPYPWTRAELDRLHAAGVALPGLPDLLEQAAAEGLRPLLAARQELLLVLPPPGEETHPLWPLLQSVVSGIPVLALEHLLAQPGDGRVAVPCQPLPTPRRYWQFDAGLAHLNREAESYSSLDLLLFNPGRWLLRYPARLKPGRLPVLADDFRLSGLLAHGLVEAFFTQEQVLQWDTAACEAWFDRAFDEQVRNAGATLLMPGRRSDLEAFRLTLRRALHTLHRLLQQSGVQRAIPEVRLQGHYPGGALTGYADLVLEWADGRRAVVDLKWSGAARYAEKLAQGRSLQLILYAEMVRQQWAGTPDLTYFIFDRGQLLVTGPDRFPAAARITATASHRQLWQRFLRTWEWRQAQLREGRVEIASVTPGSAENLDEAPADGLPLENMDPRYDDYRALTGWET